MQPADGHTYGSSCRLAPVAYPEPDEWLDGIPPIDAQFFYTSPVPIDDPLSTTAAASENKASKQPLRPFSQGDNNALEKAWLALSSPEHRRNHVQTKRRRSPDPSLTRSIAEKLDSIAQGLAAEHLERHAHEERDQGLAGLGQALGQAQDPGEADFPLCCPELSIEAADQLQKAFCGVARRRLAIDQDQLVGDVMARIRAANSTTTRYKSASVSSAGPRRDVFPRLNHQLPAPARGRSSMTEAESGPRWESRQPAVPEEASAGAAAPAPAPGATVPVRPPVADDGISGMPFARAATPGATPGPTLVSLPRLGPSTSEAGLDGDQDAAPSTQQRPTACRAQPRLEPTSPTGKAGTESAEIPVGVSRLHMVALPALQMKPIYWSPVNDIAVVLRATWFYADNYYPVEPAIANQLEAGYDELRPWTQTWADELRCAVEVGPLGEEKVSHALWPKEPDRGSKRELEAPELPISSDPFCAARCFRGEAAAEGTLDVGGEVDPSDEPAATRSYSNYHVVYKDATRAFLLKPSLKPSAYYGRRPVAKVRQGVTVGIPVVRGFDRAAWDRIHNKTRDALLRELPAALAGDDPSGGHGLTECPGCRAEKEKNQVTDLVLVAHGIGQKLAEKVESFHFTHAINAFRRSVNIELGKEAVKGILRDDHHGIMVLPLNWRLALSFDGGGRAKEEDEDHAATQAFSLADIEPDTIPAVRNVISDVMFDIPFYMNAHHKPRMISALTVEANRVVRLWRQNNPGFGDKGRVHLIAHSLGSAMAIEILSKQPTIAPRPDPATTLPRTDIFEFDTTNLFLLGSPAAFFLLLERGHLMPRRGRMKPGADSSDIVSRDVVGDVGTLGCVAVDNIYNVLAKEDPIAYLLNGTVDRAYSSSLKTAYVPSARMGFLASMMSYLPGASATPDTALPALARPPTMRLPSQLELEVHDFSREEIAERKAYLLNDNGQIDYFLHSGSGPLEIQYLNMLSAHTSYWTNQDLIRMLCMEIGRKPGKASTLPGMRAVKAAKRFARGGHASASSS